MINLNKVADKSLDLAIKRDKKKHLLDYSLDSLLNEVEELKNTKEFEPAQHMQCTAVEEELVDIIISCLTELALRNSDVEKLIWQKVRINQKRYNDSLKREFRAYRHFIK